MSKGVLGTTASWRAGPRLDWLIAGGLVVITAVAYVPVLWCGFVNYDDNVYVKDNFNLARGLSWSGIKWAFTAVVSVNWHPLTLLSLLLDYTLFGLKAWGYHLVNLLLHLANSVLLFRCLRLMTGAVWRSAVVAALFALHPLHVESVAWVSERKDVLSTLFGLLALRVYIQYVAARAVSPGRRGAAVPAKPPGQADVGDVPVSALVARLLAADTPRQRLDLAGAGEAAVVRPGGGLLF